MTPVFSHITNYLNGSIFKGAHCSAVRKPLEDFRELELSATLCSYNFVTPFLSSAQCKTICLYGPRENTSFDL